MWSISKKQSLNFPINLIQKYFDKSLKNHLSMRAIDRWLACIPRHIYVHIPKPGPGFSISICRIWQRRNILLFCLIKRDNIIIFTYLYVIMKRKFEHWWSTILSLAGMYTPPHLCAYPKARTWIFNINCTSPHICAYPKARTWVFNVLCRGIFCIQWVKARGDCSFCRH
jgi:hypothetical protein